ncbi:MAG: signal peptide peptidase SppA [Bacteroidota bacterium]
MKNFFKYTLASVLGIIISFFIIMVFFIVFISALIGAAEKKTIGIQPNAVLRINITQPVTDRTSNNPFENFDFTNFKPRPQLGLNDILKSIEGAKTDSRIKGIYLDMPFLPADHATVEEIREALIDFKESGKFILAYGDIYTQKMFFLATVADHVYLNPQGWIDFRGLSVDIFFVSEALDKLGIEPQIIRRGQYKTAVEPFTRTSMSDENRAQTAIYVNSIWKHMLDKIAASKNIPVEQLNQFADELKFMDVETLLDHNLIDGVKYKDQRLDELNELSGNSGEKDVRVDLYEYNNVIRKKKGFNTKKDRIAVVYAQGNIIVGEGEENIIGSEKTSRAIRKARKDTTVKAVVFRVNSGGGSAMASEVIWREIKLTQEVKPVIVSMGDYAASGGYYIACAADTIVANPLTITGSIGVYGIVPNVQKLLNDKLGVYFDRYKTNKSSDFLAADRPITQDEKIVLTKMVDDTYNTFLLHIKEGRNMKYEEVDKIAGGKIWSGINAKQNGLVDMLGGLNTALKVAAEKAGVYDYAVLELPVQKEPFEMLMKGFKTHAMDWMLKKELGEEYLKYKALKDVLHNKDAIQAVMPFKIDIY